MREGSGAGGAGGSRREEAALLQPLALEGELKETPIRPPAAAAQDPNEPQPPLPSPAPPAAPHRRPAGRREVSPLAAQNRARGRDTPHAPAGSRAGGRGPAGVRKGSPGSREGSLRAGGAITAHQAARGGAEAARSAGGGAGSSSRTAEGEAEGAAGAGSLAGLWRPHPGIDSAGETLIYGHSLECGAAGRLQAGLAGGSILWAATRPQKLLLRSGPVWLGTRTVGPSAREQPRGAALPPDTAAPALELGDSPGSQSCQDPVPCRPALQSTGGARLHSPTAHNCLNTSQLTWSPGAAPKHTDTEQHPAARLSYS